jgi:hypothetical protein
MLFSAPLDVARTNACTSAPRWTSASAGNEHGSPAEDVGEIGSQPVEIRVGPRLQSVLRRHVGREH